MRALGVSGYASRVSLYVFRSSLFDLSPRVWIEGDQLYARSSRLLQALSLFAVRSDVHVDGRRRTVTLERRTFWFLRRLRLVRFARVRHVTYRFGRVVTDCNAFVGATDQVESFSVGLALRDPDEEFALLRFRGLGSIGTGIGGILMGDEIVDVEGAQEHASALFVDALQKLIGVGIGEPMQVFADTEGFTWHCSACRRPGAPRPGRCLYCGAERIRGA